MSDTEPEIESDNNDDERILNAFTATVDLTKRVTKTIDDEEYLVDFKFKKMDDQDDIHIAYAKLYKVSEKLHFCHHCGVSGHTHPNCYKWLTTQQSNSMLSSRNQNQFPSSFAPLGDFL